MAAKSRRRGQEFWNDFAQRLLDPFSTTIRRVLIRMLFKYPIRRLPPELAALAKPLRAARRAALQKQRRRLGLRP
jgi:hypothetical protein